MSAVAAPGRLRLTRRRSCWRCTTASTVNVLWLIPQQPGPCVVADAGPRHLPGGIARGCRSGQTAL